MELPTSGLTGPYMHTIANIPFTKEGNRIRRFRKKALILATKLSILVDEVDSWQPWCEDLNQLMTRASIQCNSIAWSLDEEHGFTPNQETTDNHGRNLCTTRIREAELAGSSHPNLDKNGLFFRFMPKGGNVWKRTGGGDFREFTRATENYREDAVINRETRSKIIKF